MRKGNLVFFDIVEVRMPKLIRAVENMPEGMRKKQALELLESIRRNTKTEVVSIKPPYS